jgi:hypothetical protein
MTTRRDSVRASACALAGVAPGGDRLAALGAASLGCGAGLHVAGDAAAGSPGRFTVASRLLGERGRPEVGVRTYAVDARGRLGPAAPRSGGRFAVSVDGDARLGDAACIHRPDRG